MGAAAESEVWTKGDEGPHEENRILAQKVPTEIWSFIDKKFSWLCWQSLKGDPWWFI
jgi:hypothetical protein